ncbi:MAG: hypothetical protein WCK32_04975 [Chlorobiaceae bacterium]
MSVFIIKHDKENGTASDSQHAMQTHQQQKATATRSIPAALGSVDETFNFGRHRMFSFHHGSRNLKGVGCYGTIRYSIICVNDFYYLEE